MLDQAVDSRFNELVALRRHLHVHPEPSGQEQETTALLAQQLREEGLDAHTGPEERGLIVGPAGAQAPAQPLIAIR